MTAFSDCEEGGRAHDPVKPGGTREQQAVGDWLDAVALVRTRLSDPAEQVPEILPYFDRLTDAVASLGRCEVHGRSLDRARR